jgi:hypothetical protein
MRILIDMDDVIADTIERFLEWYERDFGVRFTRFAGKVNRKKITRLTTKIIKAVSRYGKVVSFFLSEIVHIKTSMIVPISNMPSQAHPL